MKFYACLVDEQILRLQIAKYHIMRLKINQIAPMQNAVIVAKFDASKQLMQK